MELLTEVTTNRLYVYLSPLTICSDSTITVNSLRKIRVICHVSMGFIE